MTILRHPLSGPVRCLKSHARMQSKYKYCFNYKILNIIIGEIDVFEKHNIDLRVHPHCSPVHLACFEFWVVGCSCWVACSCSLFRSLVVRSYRPFVGSLVRLFRARVFHSCACFCHRGRAVVCYSQPGRAHFLAQSPWSVWQQFVAHDDSVLVSAARLGAENYKQAVEFVSFSGHLSLAISTCGFFRRYVQRWLLETHDEGGRVLRCACARFAGRS